MKRSEPESQIHVIGTDASGLTNLPRSLEELLLTANAIAAPKRLHKSLKEYLPRLYNLVM